jgi:hypothetical protein
MSRLTEGLRRANERDRKFIMSLNLELLEKILLPLFIAYLCLEFMDVYSTLLALRNSLVFHELNPIASALFSMKFDGFLLATFWKYLPGIPLFYAVFVKDPQNRHPFGLRMARFVGLVSLISIDGLLFYIVGWNNIPTLITYLNGG